MQIEMEYLKQYLELYWHHHSLHYSLSTQTYQHACIERA